MMKNRYLERIASLSPVIFDGAMGTQILQFDIKEKDFDGHNGCNEILSLTRPEVIEEIHKGYLLAGAHVIETNTFGANSIKLAEYGLDDRFYEINKTAAMLACKAIERTNKRNDCFVCGSMGPTGMLLSSGNVDKNKPLFDDISALFGLQAAALIDGGADILLLETMQDLLEVRAALIGIRRMLDERSIEIPVQVHATFDAAGHMLLGSDINAFCGAVINLGCDVIGMNCSAGPFEMKQWGLDLLAKSNIPVAMLPNAGMPKNVNDKAVYDMPPEEFADTLEPLVVKNGLSVVGGCCGTSPLHIKALAARLSDKKVAPRKKTARTYLSTGISGSELESEKKPIIIGERLNAQGSKKTKDFILSYNLDELYQIGIEQIEKGSGLLDVCVAVSENDNEQKTMTSLISFLSERVRVPFCIDSTEPAVFEAALRVCPGSALVNSINLEQGGDKARVILSLAKEFGCPVIALTIDDNGMAKTVQKKLEITRRLVDLACNEFGLPKHFIYIDPLTFTLATGDAESADAAKHSLEALFRIKDEMPDVRTAMGVSNVSYGLKPASRRILNNVMLHHAVKAGLDAAIFNPLHYDDISTYDASIRTLAEDLLFNRKTDALSLFVNAFDTIKPQLTIKNDHSSVTATPKQQLHDKIVNRDKRDLPVLIDTLLTTQEPQEILNEILLPAMAFVGDKMNTGDMILPFVLQAAEVMKEAISILGPHLAKTAQGVRGKIVLATVYGDVHDIGKNLVGSILKNQGYEVVDLGKQVSSDTIIAAVKKEKPDAIGLSALLVATSKEMSRLVIDLDREGLSVPVLIGGAAVNRDFATRISKLENNRSYSGGVFYAKDAFEASRVLDSLKNGTAQTSPQASAKVMTTSNEQLIPSPDPLEHPEIIHPHFFGTSQVLRWSAQELLDAIDTTRLFKGYFGGGNLDENTYKETVTKEFLPILESLKIEIISNNLLDAAGLYAIFPVYTNDEKLVILDPFDFSTQCAEFIMPKMQKKNNRSIADYFRTDGDVVAIQIVTIGQAMSNDCTRYFSEENKYSKGFYLNAIANYITEQLADKVTQEIKRAFFIKSERGRRYSFGYPGLPGVEKQKDLFELMGIEERIGVSLTSAFQMEPEHSTMGMFVHHPMAEYF